METPSICWTLVIERRTQPFDSQKNSDRGFGQPSRRLRKHGTTVSLQKLPRLHSFSAYGTLEPRESKFSVLCALLSVRMTFAMFDGLRRSKQLMILLGRD